MVITDIAKMLDDSVAELVRVISATTLEAVDETVPDPVTGAYSITVPDTDSYYVIAHADGLLSLAHGPVVEGV